MASEKQIAANRANALLSTGPKSEEGKANSRANALKHGLSSLVVVPGEEQGAVATRVEWLQDSMTHHDDPLTLILARQVGFLSVQLERGFRFQTALAADRARHAEDDFDDARHTAAEEHLNYIGADPVTHHRRLMRSIEGVDLLIQQIEELSRIGRPGSAAWTMNHCITLYLCCGRHSGGIPCSRARALTNLIEHDIARDLDPAEAPAADRLTQHAWAVAEVHKLVDAELDRLRAHRATLDPGKHAVSRAQSPSRALFGMDKEMRLYRRYQVAAMRALSRFVDQIREREGDLNRRTKATLRPAELVEARRRPRTWRKSPAPGRDWLRSGTC